MCKCNPFIGKGWLPERADSQAVEKGGHDRVMPSEMYHPSLSLVVGKRRGRRKTC